MLNALETLRQSLPPFAEDIKLNLHSALTETSLTTEQRWGAAMASALATGNTVLRDATLADARAATSDAVIDDARAAATLMAMTNVFFRARHMIDKPSYESRPPRLRMSRIKQPASSKSNLELFCLAVSAVNGCEECLRAHEKSATDHGLTEEQIVDTLRIAAVMEGAATALFSMP